MSQRIVLCSMPQDPCPTDRELVLGLRRPELQKHLEVCPSCVGLMSLIHRITADANSIMEMSEVEVDKVTRLVFNLLRDNQDG